MSASHQSGSDTTAPLRVVLVGDHPPPHGGVAVHVAELHQALRDAQAEACVLDIGKGQVPAPGVVPAGSSATFAARLALLAGQGMRIHVHTSGANPKSWVLAAGCAAVGRATGRHALITFHSGLGPDWFGKTAARRAMAAQVAASFGTVIAVNETIAQALRACGVPADKVHVIPAFGASHLPVGELPQSVARLRAQTPMMLSAMLAPGAVYGAEPLLQAFSRVLEQVPAARLVVYGPSTGEAALAELCRSILGDRASCVHRCGELDRAAALAIVKASDGFVRPTLADGDSVSVREALALGRPVVATDVGHRPEGVVRVPSGDPAALAAALLALREGGAGRPAPACDGLQQVMALYRKAAGVSAERSGADSGGQADTAGENATCAASVAS